jgi:uracil-DNA glycosylase
MYTSPLLNGVKSSWHDLIINNSHFANTVNTLNKSNTIVPSMNSIFKAFTYFEVTDTKMVIIGMDPYPNPEYAMGLAFSVPKGVTVPMSLKNIYKEMYDDGIFPFSTEENITEEHGDLTQWAERGVLLLNTALSLELSLGTGSHCKLWEPFINELLTSMSNVFKESSVPVTYLLMGNHAKSKSKFLNKSDTCTILTSAHPSPLSYRHFKGSHILLHALESVQNYYPEFTYQL